MTAAEQQGVGHEGELDLAQVAYASDATEGELIQGLLEGAGIPSLLQPDVNGPQRVMVRAKRADEALAVLAKTEDEDAKNWSGISGDEHPDAVSEGGRSREQRAAVAYARVHLWLLAGMAGVLGIFLLLRFA